MSIKMDNLSLTCNLTVSEQELGKISLFKKYPDGLLLFAVSCCILYMLIGIPGNVITIIALARCKKIQNATTVFIMNLACSDMLFCCFNLPLISTQYWRRSWSFGIAMCRLVPLAGYGLVAVSLLSILAIMVNRYILIAHPRQYPRIYTTRYIAIMIISIWIASFMTLIPTWFEKWGRFGMDLDIESCSILKDCNERSPKKFLFIVAFLIPCFLVLVCYLRIFCIVKNSANRCSTLSNFRRSQRNRSVSTAVTESRSQKPSSSNVDITPAPLNHEPESSRFPSVCLDAPYDNNTSKKGITRCTREIFQRLQSFAAVKRAQPSTRTIRHSSKDNKVLQMVMTVIVSFWVCYLPITFIKLFREFSVPAEVRVIGYLLVYLTTCINPIIYVVMSNEYRQAYKSLFVREVALNLHSATGTKNTKEKSKISDVTQDSRRIYMVSTV